MLLSISKCANDDLQVYPLSVCLLNVWLEVLWILEVVDEVSEVEVLRLDALVVRDVRNLRHSGLYVRLSAGRDVLGIEMSKESLIEGGWLREMRRDVTSSCGAITPLPRILVGSLVSQSPSSFAASGHSAKGTLSRASQLNINLTLKREDILQAYFQTHQA